MAILRLATAQPTEADYGSGHDLFTATEPMIVSVIISNKDEATKGSYVYTVPSGSELVPAEWGIIAYNLKITGYNTYETFRFAMNANDTLYVAGASDLAYFVQGTAQ